MQLASSSASGSSHSPCSPILPPAVSANAAAVVVAAAQNTAAAAVAVQVANQTSSISTSALPLSGGEAVIGSSTDNSIQNRAHTKEEDLGNTRNDAEGEFLNASCYVHCYVVY